MKKIFLVFLSFICLFLINQQEVSAQKFDITSDNVILYNLNDNNILYELASNEKVGIASLTKIMTTIVAIENIKNYDEEVTITKEVFKDIYGYSQMGLKVGNKLTYKDLLYGIMLPSGADAVNAIAINLAGNTENFVKLMNQKALELNLTNTKFDNPIGKDSKENYSTAKDIATLLRYSLNNELFKEIFYTKEYTIKNLKLTIKSTLIGYSKNLGLEIDNIKGAKSGFTDEAGLCLASIANYDDVEYLLIVIGADTNNRANAIKDTLEIYNHYSTNYSYKEIVTKDQLIKTLPIKYGYEKNYQLKSNQEIYLFLENTVRKNRIKYIYEGIEELNYKVKKGDKLGIVKVMYENKELTSFDVYLNDTLEYHYPLLYLIILVSALIMFISLMNIQNKKRKTIPKKRRRRRSFRKK